MNGAELSLVRVLGGHAATWPEQKVAVLGHPRESSSQIRHSKNESYFYTPVPD
jgi:hypothetical protein